MVSLRKCVEYWPIGIPPNGSHLPVVAGNESMTITYRWIRVIKDAYRCMVLDTIKEQWYNKLMNNKLCHLMEIFGRTSVAHPNRTLFVSLTLRQTTQSTFALSHSRTHPLSVTLTDTHAHRKHAHLFSL